MEEDLREQLSAHNLRRLRISVDAILVALSWVLAYWLRYALSDFVGKPINPFRDYLPALPMIVIAWLLSCWFFGVYHRSRTKTAIERIQDLLKSVLLGLLLLCSIGFLFKEWSLGRAVVLLNSAMNFCLLGVSWWLFRRLERRQSNAGTLDVPVLIIGNNEMGIRVLQRIEDDPEVGYDVAGFLTVDEEGAGVETFGGRPVLGSMSELPALVKEHQVAEVFMACPEVESTQVFGLINACESLDVGFWMVTDAFEVLSRNRDPLGSIGELPLIQLNGTAPSFFYEVFKRFFDLVAASILLVLSAPMWLYWAFRIKQDSPGPVFFTQERCGHNGARFRIYKFRTMGQDAEAYAEAPRDRADTRITPYGAWLRRTSIDEVPQLLNIIKGDMSLVGPRPEMPFIVDTYSDWQRARLAVKPGLTGLWQILGRKDLPMHDNLQYDFYYIHNRSFSLDLSILIRTVFVVLWRKGAF